VPFALLGGALLLAVAAWGSLAVASVVSPRRPGPATAVLVAGTAVLVAVETLTATRFGTGTSDALALARAAGLLLVAAGLYGGALAGPAGPPARPRPAAGTTAAVVVPLGAGTAAATVTVAAAVLAAAAAVRARRDLCGVLLALGLVMAGAAAAVAPAARDGERAVLAVLGLRAVAAALVLAAVLVLARTSLLAKVVAAIVAGVLAMGAAAVGVVGTTVAAGYEREQATLVRDAATGREQLIRQSLDRIRVLAPVFARGCGTAGFDPGRCDGFVRLVTEESSEDFALLVPRAGEPVGLGGRAPLSPAEALGLAGGDLVRTAGAGGPDAARDPVGRPVRLLGAAPGLALVVAEPLDRPTPTDEAGAVFLYGVRLGQGLVEADFDAGGFGYTLLADDDVVASNLSERARDQVVEAAAAAGSVPRDGVTVPAEGSRPTVHLRPLVARDDQQVGTIAMSRRADEALAAQRDALRALLLTALGTTAAVAGLAVLLGRQTVQPVRRLTAAARRVTAGDLATRTGVRSADEVGTLAGTFDAMTGSLHRLTGDLRASAARLEAVLASMSDGLLVADEEGRVTSVNRAGLAMTGLGDLADVVGRPLAEVLDLRADGGGALALDPATTRDEPADVHRADGGATPVRVAVTPLDRGDGAPGGLVVVLRDTTQEREVERMKSEFLSNVSHELRTPLTPIRGYADLLASRPGLEPEQVASFATTILAEALKMNRVVDLLVDVAAVEAGRISVDVRPVDPRALLDERLDVWRERAPHRSEDLRRRTSAALPPVLVDPAWLGKVLDELVDNAVKHTPPGTPVLLTAAAAPDGSRVRVAVRDAGPGLDLSHRELLFTAFEQEDGSATRRVGGLGLGLSFVRRVAQDVGWPLTVTSPRAGGRGAEFALDLPVSEEPPAVSPRASRAAPRRARAPGRGRSPARPGRRRSP
jgi:two-component system, OmpR family, sensor histidine kinase VicK